MTPASWWRERTPRMRTADGPARRPRVCRATPGGRLISTLTAASTPAKATTPASTVMDVRKLISSIRVYMTSRNARSLPARDAPPGRRRVRSLREPGLLPLDEPGIAPDNTRRNVHTPT